MWNRKGKYALTCALLALFFCFPFFGCDGKDSAQQSSLTEVESSVEGGGTENSPEGEGEEGSSSGGGSNEGNEGSGGGSNDGDNTGGGEDKQEYLLTYLVHGNAVHQVQYEEGERIAPYTPTLQGWECFVGWENLPERMPAQALTASARIEEKQNYLTLTERALGNGLTEITLSVHGEVCFAGITGELIFGAALTVVETDFNAYLGEVNAQGNVLSFVCSQGKNITSDGELFSLTVSQAGASLRVEELLAFGNDGKIIAVRYEME